MAAFKVGKMLQRVLVLEKNRETAARLHTALERNGAGTISLVPTMREACLIVAQQPQDIAFVPLEDADQLLHSLRAFQPDLKMIVTSAEPNPKLPHDFRGVVQGLLHTETLEKELPGLLGGRQSSLNAVPSLAEKKQPSQPGLGRFKEACQELGLIDNKTPAHLAVLAFNGKILDYCGRGSASHAALIARLISRNWERELYTAQLQFLHLEDYYDPRLIYSRSVAGAVLSLVADPDVPFSAMRKLANQLARRLSKGEQERNEADHSINIIGRPKGSVSDEKTTPAFAIAWQPVKPLPKMLQDIVEECVKSISRDMGCTLRHLSITPTVVHLVIQCPSDKTAAWTIYKLKSGINQEIQSRFGTRITIWRKGFYAAESDQPLKESELNLLLAS